MKRGNCSTIGVLTAFFIMAFAIPAFAAWVKLGADVRITNDASTSWRPSLVWTGTEYGASWKDQRDGNQEIYFARMDSTGNKLGADVRITNDASWSEYPSLVWPEPGMALAGMICGTGI